MNKGLSMQVKGSLIMAYKKQKKIPAWFPLTRTGLGWEQKGYSADQMLGVNQKGTGSQD